MIGPGKPNETRSNFQSRTDLLTAWTILRGVMVGPDGYFRGSFWPLASILTFVPPRSMTRTFGDLPTRAASIAAPSRRGRIDCFDMPADNEFYDELIRPGKNDKDSLLWDHRRSALSQDAESCGIFPVQ